MSHGLRAGERLVGDLRRHGRIRGHRPDHDRRQGTRRTRTRISTFCAGIFLFLLVVVFDDFVSSIPMVAFVAVMIMVTVGAFDWHSVKPSTLKRIPKSETFVMVSPVLLVLVTHNLAIGVVGGVLVASVLFVRRVAHLVSVSRAVSPSGNSVTYVVNGELFLASSIDLTTLFSYSEDPRVVVDLSGSRIWDASTVAALMRSRRSTRRSGRESRSSV